MDIIAALLYISVAALMGVAAVMVAASVEQVRQMRQEYPHSYSLWFLVVGYVFCVVIVIIMFWNLAMAVSKLQ